MPFHKQRDLRAPHMASLDRLATAIAAYLPLITLIMLVAEARELRPSNHGLEYQVPPPTGQKSPPEMMSFFGNTSSSSSTPVNVAQPKAMNSSDSSWWESGSGSGSGGRSGGGDRLRHVLLVASLVCGGTGAALLVATAFIHLYRFQKRRSSTSSRDSNANNSIVIRK